MPDTMSHPPSAATAAAFPQRLSLTRPPHAPATTPLHTVIVLPGGGYGRHAPHEEHPIVDWAHALGFAAAVLHYSVAPHANHPNPLNDCLEAVRFLRRNKAPLFLTGRIAVLGFSAGGHCAATLSTHGAFDPETRVDASVLVYPVITMLDPHTHAGSRENLLGPAPTDEQKRNLSAELQVTANTPPAFLVHGCEDTPVPAENSLLYAGALRRHGVPVELHLYPQGPHGFGMGNEGRLPEGTPIAEWPRLAGVWLKRTLA